MSNGDRDTDMVKWRTNFQEQESYNFIIYNFIYNFIF